MRQHHADALAPGPDASPLRRKAYEVIFGHDTTAGRTFDVLLIAAILGSVAAIMLESVPSAQRIRELRPGLRAIFMSGYASPQGSFELPPGEALLEKPFLPHTLGVAIRAALCGEGAGPLPSAPA